MTATAAVREDRQLTLFEGDTLVTHARIARWAETASAEQLQIMYEQARELHKRSWIAMAILMGVASARTENRLLLKDLAKTFDVSLMTASRYVRLYSAILSHRIEAQGDLAEFGLWEEAYFLLALEAERYTEGKPNEIAALAVIEIGEDGNFNSVGAFKRHLIDQGLLEDPDAGVEVAFRADGEIGRVLKAIVKLSEVGPEVARDVLDRLQDIKLDVGKRLTEAIDFLLRCRDERDRALAAWGGKGGDNAA